MCEYQRGYKQPPILNKCQGKRVSKFIKMSAEKYARKSAQKNGGTPVVYEVEPVNPFCINAGQYICDKAYVLNSYEVQ